MHVTHATDDQSAPGPAETFTGRVRLDNHVQASAPGRVGAATVTFEPGARSAWHSHPLGQLLVVTSGVGWVQAESGPKQTIRAGDTVWTEPGESHWHGATATKAMSHVAIQEALDGSAVHWGDHVDDDTYLS